MKKSFDLRLIVILFAAILYSLSSSAQGFEKLDDVPHDIAYYITSKITMPLVKVLYRKSTHTKYTEVFEMGDCFNELLRTGANEATEIKIYKDVMFGKKLDKCRNLCDLYDTK